MKKLFTFIAALLIAVSAMSETEVVKFTVTATENVVVPKETTVDLASYATITNGATASIFNGKDVDVTMINSSGYINFSSSSHVYLSITLANNQTFHENDKLSINFGKYSSNAVRVATSDTGNNAIDITAQDSEVYLTSEFEGISTIYIMRTNNVSTSYKNISGLTVYRSEINEPVIKYSEGKVIMTSGTEGANIYYSTSSGVTPETGTLYTGPFGIVSSTTFYAIAEKDGKTSYEASQKVVVVTCPGYENAFLVPETPLGEGVSDVALESLSVKDGTDQYKLSGTFSQTTAYSDGALYNQLSMNMLKMSGSLTLQSLKADNTYHSNIVGLRIYAVNDADTGTATATVSNMECTTNQEFSARSKGVYYSIIDYAVTNPSNPVYKSTITFSSRVRGFIQVFTSEQAQETHANPNDTKITHYHSFSTTWTQTADGHYHACIASSCYITDYATCGLSDVAYGKHVYGTDLTTEDYYICQTCQYVSETRKEEYKVANNKLELSDENPTIISDIYSAGHVTYTRITTSGKYATFCLPYDVAMDDVSGVFSGVYTVAPWCVRNPSTGLLQLMLNKKRSGAIITAGTPFIACAKITGSSVIPNLEAITFGETTADPEPTSLIVYDNTGGSVLMENTDLVVKVGGTYTKMIDVDSGKYRVFDTSANFNPATWVNCFRAYIYKDDAQSSAKISQISLNFIDDDNATDISAVTGYSVVSQSKECYNLSGQRVNMNACQKGIFIINGKKVINK